MSYYFNLNIIKNFLFWKCFGFKFYRNHFENFFVIQPSKSTFCCDNSLKKLFKNQITILMTLASFWSWTISGRSPAMLLVLDPDMMLEIDLLVSKERKQKREKEKGRKGEKRARGTGDLSKCQVILEQIKISPDQCLFILFRPIDEIT
jgi:hypothetical protein